MKNLIINISLISSLLIGQVALAESQVTADKVSPTVELNQLETIVVMSEPEVANFEIFSDKITKNAVDSAMELMLNDLAFPLNNEEVSLVSVVDNSLSSI